MRCLRLVFIWFGLSLPFLVPTASSQVVHWLEVEDIIGPVSSRYMIEAIDHAEARQAELLVIRLDTPGGLMASMRDFIKHMLAADVPVCIYVGPEGARAASAGTFMMMGAHVAAMTPGTHLGAASPVAMGGAQLDSTMASKVFEDSEAYIRSLARMRHRNEEWAVSAVRHAKAIPAQEALDLGVIDFLAITPGDLLRQINGFTVSFPGDSTRTLNTTNATIENQELSLRYRLLSLLNNPTVAYLLLMLGFYGLFFELSNPGAIFPGVVGAIALISGLMGLQTLSLNYAGLLLIVLAFLLFFLEIQITSHGLLAIGGSVALLAGSLMLFDSPEPFLRVSKAVILPVVLLTAAFFVFAVGMALRAQRRRVVSGREQLLGMTGTVVETLDPVGTVFIVGEHWTAESVSSESIPQETLIQVIDVDHLRLLVEVCPKTQL